MRDEFVLVSAVLSLSTFGFGLSYLLFSDTLRQQTGQATPVKCSHEADLASFASVVAHLPGIVYRCALDEHWTMEFISDEIETLSGFPASDFVRNHQRTYASLIHPEDAGVVDQEVRAAVRDQRPFALEYRIITKQGQIRWVLERGRAYVPSSLNQLVYLDGVILDNSERMEARFALIEQQEFVRKVTELSPELIFVFSAVEGRILYANDKIQKMFDYSKHVFCALPLASLVDMVHPEDREKVAQFYGKVVGLGDDDVIESEHRMRRANGEFIWVRQRVSIFRRDCFSQAIETLNVLEDITLQKQTLLELERQRSNATYVAKMASLGEMAGGIAHEINNPLAIILARAKQMEILLRRDPVDHTKLRESLSSMMQTSERITTIIRGLRSFARDGSQDPLVRTTLSEILKDSISLCESRMFELNIDFRVHEGEESYWPLNARPVQISQILLNLISNAIDAALLCPKPWIRMETFEEEDGLGFRVIDSGPGVPEGLQEKIMTPFFTTKPSGRGTGLGLSISRTIAVAHGGDLWLDTQASATTFVLKLPRGTDIQEEISRDEGKG
jgi:PAS domain S-box-containing protein